MIKQIWFIRNERKLINALCFTIGAVMLLYSLLSVWAMASDQLLRYDTAALKPTLFALMAEQFELLVLPLLSLAICGILFFMSNHAKPVKNCIDKRVAALQKQFRRDMLIGSNLLITLILAFFQLDKISLAKGVSGFGLVPVYICIAGGVIYYIWSIKKLLSGKDEVA